MSAMHERSTLPMSYGGNQNPSDGRDVRLYADEFDVTRDGRTHA